MGFDQFGIVSFTSATKAEQFVDFLKDNELRGTVCLDCGAKFFPPRTDCCYCLSDRMDWFAIAGEGKLVSFTTAMFAPAGFEKDVPYTLGVAEFADGTKVFGRINRSIPQEQIKVGMAMKTRAVDLGEGRLTYELIAA